MNKAFLGGSAFLTLLGIGCVLLPFPGPWLMPVLVALGWYLVFRAGAPSRDVAPPPATTLAEVLPPPQAEIVTREVLPPGFPEDMGRFRVGLEVLGGLKSLVVKDTEEAVLRLTEALFTLVGNSKEVTSHIEKSLTFITDGDSGLGKTVANLEEQVRVFEALASHFTQLKTGLTSDIGALTKTVGSINQFSETLSDLADQTNVLAINASIEAARVGIHGRGFAVIATQVQTLARNSKDISEKMARTVRDVVASVETSFGRQTQRILEAEGLIVRSEKELRRWADHVGPQLTEVGTMVEGARRLAGVVTQELDDVTVSLQFQDRTRQVLDHMAEILEEFSTRIVRSSGQSAQPIPPVWRQEAFDAASRRFTVREEWDLVAGGGTKSRHTATVELF